MKNILKNLALLTAALLVVFSAQTQIYNPVKWTYETEKVSDTEYNLLFKATIEAGWHVYSLETDLDGMKPMVFDYKELEGVELVGTTIEPEAHKEFDPMFDAELAWFEKQVTFTQAVKLTGGAGTVKGEMTYMTCDDSKCLPPEYVDFEFELGGKTGDAPAESGTNEIYQPVKWTFSVEDLGNDEHYLIASAAIDDSWHVYSKDLPSEDGPVATEMNFEFPDGVEVIGELEEIGDLHNEYDPNFAMDLAFYADEMKFRQKIKTTDSEAVVEGEVYFMTCDESKCLPPESIRFKMEPAKGTAINLNEIVEEPTSEMPADDRLLIESVDLDNPANNCGVEVEESNEDESDVSYMYLFLLGFGGGLLALLTPCVFPMIPLTVSFFTKGSENRQKGIFNAVTYGLFIFLIYVILSLPFHFLDSIDPEILNTISTNVWLNVFFFVIFVVFAISFFGYFELTMPSSFTNKMDAKSDVGGLLGTFFMALTLALVSFSCTGPILGSLLAGSLSSDGGALQLTAGMGGFGAALALPFALFALFPGWLNSLPKSGGWLNSVKVVLGFVELALAVKFLSNADLVEHWGIIKREVFFGVWILVGIGLSLYLFGIIKFPHDSPNAKIGKGRMAFGVAVVLFTIYLIPGISNTKYANLSLLSGFPPPLFYSLYEKESNCPLDIQCFKDYDEGLAYARANNKPIMIDFTGWACVNCRRMEENVWVKQEIWDRLNGDFVLISLYVDDRKDLPEDEQFEYVTKDGRRKKIKTVGNKWATLQTETFVNNSQPYYALLSPDEELLNRPVGYTPDVNEYKEFLDCGLAAWNGQQAMNKQ